MAIEIYQFFTVYTQEIIYNLNGNQQSIEGVRYVDPANYIDDGVWGKRHTQSFTATTQDGASKGSVSPYRSSSDYMHQSAGSITLTENSSTAIYYGDKITYYFSPKFTADHTQLITAATLTNNGVSEPVTIASDGLSASTGTIDVKGNIVCTLTTKKFAWHTIWTGSETIIRPTIKGRSSNKVIENLTIPSHQKIRAFCELDTDGNYQPTEDYVYDDAVKTLSGCRETTSGGLDTTDYYRYSMIISNKTSSSITITTTYDAESTCGFIPIGTLSVTSIEVYY